MAEHGDADERPRQQDDGDDQAGELPPPSGRAGRTVGLAARGWRDNTSWRLGRRFAVRPGLLRLAWSGRWCRGGRGWCRRSLGWRSRRRGLRRSSGRGGGGRPSRRLGRLSGWPAWRSGRGPPSRGSPAVRCGSRGVRRVGRLASRARRSGRWCGGWRCARLRGSRCRVRPLRRLVSLRRRSAGSLLRRPRRPGAGRGRGHPRHCRAGADQAGRGCGHLRRARGLRRRRRPRTWGRSTRRAGSRWDGWCSWPGGRPGVAWSRRVPRRCGPRSRRARRSGARR